MLFSTEVTNILLIVLFAIVVIGFIVALFWHLKTKKQTTVAATSEVTTEDTEKTNFEKILTSLKSVDTRQQDQKTDIDNLNQQFINLRTHLIKEEATNTDFKTNLQINLKDLYSNISKLDTKITQTYDSGEKLNSQISNLNRVFFSSSKRGVTGEASLSFILYGILGNNQDIVKTQYQMRNGYRADVFILAEQTNIPIDSKFPFADFEALLTADNDINKAQAFKDLNNRIKKHITDVQKYVSEADKTEQALMYLPSQQLFEMIYAEKEFRDLHNFALKKKVAIVGPNTLPIVLQLILNFVEKKRRSKQIAQTLQFLKNLEENWQRFHKRWEKTCDNFKTFTKNFDSFNLSTRKISNNLEMIFNNDPSLPPIKEAKKPDTTAAISSDLTDNTTKSPDLSLDNDKIAKT